MRKKAKKFFPENPGFPDPDPDFRISAHRVEMGGPKATCSQNFRPLGAVVSKCLRPLTIIKYRIFFIDSIFFLEILTKFELKEIFTNDSRTMLENS